MRPLQTNKQTWGEVSLLYQNLSLLSVDSVAAHTFLLLSLSLHSLYKSLLFSPFLSPYKNSPNTSLQSSSLGLCSPVICPLNSSKSLQSNIKCLRSSLPSLHIKHSVPSPKCLPLSPIVKQFVLALNQIVESGLLS